MPITAERLEVDVQANTSDAKRDLDKFNKSTTSSGAAADAAGGKAAQAGKKFNIMGGLVKAASGAMVASLAGKTIGAASDLNEQLSKTGTVFGGQAKIVTSGAQEMADAFGMNKSEFLEAASGIGLVGKASGLTKKAAAGLSVDMAKLAADASSFYNVPVTEALDAMKSGLVGEAEPMRKFGVLMNEATVNAEALALGIVKPIKNTVALKAAQADAATAQKAYTAAVAEHGRKSPEAAKAALALQKAQEAVGKAAKGVIPELTEGQKVQARSSLIMKGMKDASGDLAKTQTSVANRVRELQGRLVNFAADMGTKALPAVETFLTVLIEGPAKIKAVVNAITGWTDSHPMLTKAIGITAAIITAVFIPAMVRAAAVATVTKVKVVAAWVAQQLAAAKSAAMVAVTFATTVAGWVAMAAAATANAARVVAGWVLMGAQSLLQAARMAAAWVIAMGPVGWAIAAAVAVGVAIYKNWDKIVAATKAAWSAVSGFLVGAWDKIKSTVMAGVNATINFVKNNWKKIVAILLGPLGIVVGLIVSNWSTIKNTFSSGVQAIQNLWTNAWNKIKSTVQTGVSKVVGFVKSLPGKITGALGDLGGLLKNAGTAVIDGFWNGLKAKWEDVKNWFGSVTDAIPNLKGPRAKDRGLLIENGKAVMEGFKEGLLREWSDVRKFLQDATKWVQNSAMDDKTQKVLEGRLERVGKRVKALLKRNTALAEKMTAAVQDHADKVQAQADFRQNTFAGMNNQANVLNSGNTGAAIAKSLADQVRKVQEFGLKLANLAARGLNRDAIAQIAAAGVEGGSAVADALTNATDTELGSINASFSAINAAATATSDTLADNLYGAGINAAQGVIDGIQAKQDLIKSTLKTIAQGMIEAVREVVAKAVKEEAAAQKAAAAKAAKEKADEATGGGSDAPAPGGKGKGKGKKPKPGPGAMGGGANGGGSTTFAFTTHNPQAEPESRTTNNALDRLAALGLI